jgi:hypothetical protein
MSPIHCYEAKIGFVFVCERDEQVKDLWLDVGGWVRKVLADMRGSHLI